MLPELTKLKITAVHCEHLLTHLVTGDGREEALDRQTWLTTIIISTLVYTQPTVKHKIVLHDGRSWEQLCSHSGRATR